ncbi:uncharacterized protein [Physcomitrium patens]|nr:uncharacterized protein LOC112280173 isoform X2 [Physcomitrium patens]|eukprot:XP_024371101.1 uncharacterized protein LOC112280173 isoform X2 [Physcomitrella patens]
MSIISKASSESGRTFESEGSFRGTGRARTSPSECEESSCCAFPGSEPRKTGDAQGPNKQGGNTPRKSGVIGLSVQPTENAFSGAEGNGWSASHDASSGKSKKTITAPLRPTLLAGADKTASETVKKKKYGVFTASKPTNIKSNPSKFLTFNSAYVSNMEDFDRSHHDCAKDSDLGLSRHVQRTIMTPLLKPIPSKWDDAEKWIPRGDKIKSMRAKVRSGPPLIQMVARQDGVTTPWKSSSTDPHPDTHLRPAQRSQSELGENAGDGAGTCVSLKYVTEVAEEDISKVAADEKERLDSICPLRSVQSYGGSSSPECTGSFLKLGARVKKPLEETSPAMKDVGTAMTPTASVEPSRAGTPIGTPGSGNRADMLQVSSLRHHENDAAPTDKSGGAESLRVWTAKELQEKTRLEIVALGTQLGKVNIAAWAARDEKYLSTPGSRSKDALEVEHIWTDAVATKAAATEEAEKAKLNSRFQLEQAKIQKWEEHENTKAEAEMRSVEIKAEHMLSQAHKKLANKMAALQHQAATLRLAAETQRVEAAAKAAKKAKAMKSTGRFLNFLILPSFCK